MRRSVICIVGLSISIFFAGLASSLTAQAVTVKPPTHLDVIETLKKAHGLLVHADHDYDGHRAKAAEEVHKALEDLGDHPAKKATRVLVPTAGGVVAVTPVHPAQPKMTEPQAASDAQVHEAKELLEAALKDLSSSKHPNAHKNVKEAIHQITLALERK